MTFDNYYYIKWKKYAFNSKTISGEDGVLTKINENGSHGFYQIYGYHPVYGQETLLYIGKAQDFYERLKRRWEFVESIAKPISVRIGRFYKTENIDENNINDIIDYIERLLIRAHLPAFNCQNTKYLYKPESLRNIVVINWDDFGMLLPEISDVRLSYNEWENTETL